MFWQNSPKVVQNNAKKWKIAEKYAILVLLSDHLIELKSLDFIE